MTSYERVHAYSVSIKTKIYNEAAQKYAHLGLLLPMQLEPREL